jgi:hypothetical protein
MRNMNKVFIGKPEGKRLLGRTSCRWGIILNWISKQSGWE